MDFGKVLINLIIYFYKFFYTNDFDKKYLKFENLFFYTTNIS